MFGLVMRFRILHFGKALPHLDTELLSSVFDILSGLRHVSLLLLSSGVLLHNSVGPRSVELAPSRARNSATVAMKGVRVGSSRPHALL